MSSDEAVRFGLSVGFVLGLLVGFAVAASDWRAAEVVAEYKSGKLVCSAVGQELVCRSAK